MSVPADSPGTRRNSERAYVARRRQRKTSFPHFRKALRPRNGHADHGPSTKCAVRVSSVTSP